VRRGRVLPRSFYARPSYEVAPELLGAVVESETTEGVVAVRLVEVEAYAGPDDPASHAWRGPTPRTAVMFGPPGHSYVYFTYGMHWCLNVVAEPSGVAAGVLLRAGEVVEGLALAQRRRGARVPVRRLASGPANLAAALGLDGADNGLDVTRASGSLRLRAGAATGEIVRAPRVGISRAVDVAWRFALAGDLHVSAPRPS
jgi:DNA-3-methyladenine glycosylase